MSDSYACLTSLGSEFRPVRWPSMAARRTGGRAIRRFWRISFGQNMPSKIAASGSNYAEKSDNKFAFPGLAGWPSRKTLDNTVIIGKSKGLAQFGRAAGPAAS